jgi:hypothetical protein
MGYGLGGHGSIPDRSSISLQHIVQTSSGFYPASYPVGVRGPGIEADHSLPSSVDVKNDGVIFPHPHTCSWLCAELIKLRVRFTFTTLERPRNTVIDLMPGNKHVSMSPLMNSIRQQNFV